MVEFPAWPDYLGNTTRGHGGAKEITNEVQLGTPQATDPVT